MTAPGCGTGAAGQAPDGFVCLVQDALAHLYEPAYLDTHPLVHRINAGQGRGRSAGAELRRRLLDAIEQLKPLGAPRNGRGAEPARASRRARLLQLRYVEALEAKQVRAALGLGKTQYYAEQARAIDAVASLLHAAGGWLGQRDERDQRVTAVTSSHRSPYQGGAVARDDDPVAVALDALPPALSSFVGRIAELTALRRMMDNGARLVTITGAGGVGKTRLAVQLAALLRDEDSRRVSFVDLSAVRDAALVLPAMARLLGVQDDNTRPLIEQLTTALRATPRLVLLDNLEQVLAAAPDLARLAAACPGSVLVVTSRAALRVDGERVFTLRPLPLPPPIEGAAPQAPSSGLQRQEEQADIARWDAVRLFADRAQAVFPDFTLGTENTPAVAAICGRLDGLPLAIELAAAHVRVLPVEMLLEHLDRRLTLLVDGRRDAPARQQTLRDTIAWSYDLLSPSEQRLFRRLAVFAGGWTLIAAEQVCADLPTPGDRPQKSRRTRRTRSAPSIAQADVLGLLARLVDQSLVVGEPRAAPPGASPRFTMLETVREFALERLAAAGEAAQVRERHAAFFLSLAEEAAPRLRSAEQLAWIARLQAEDGNLHAALDCCASRAEAGDVEAGQRGLRFAAALAFRYWHIRGRRTIAERWLARLLAAPGAAAPTPARALVQAAASHSVLPEAKGDADWATLQESLDVVRMQGSVVDRIALVDTLSIGVNRPVRASAPFAAIYRRIREQVLALAEETGHPLSRGQAAQLRAVEAVREGDVRAGRRYCEQAAVLLQEVGDRWMMARNARRFGDILLADQDYLGARDRYASAQQLHREIEDQLGIAHTHLELAAVAAESGDLDQARSLVREARAVCAAAGIDFDQPILPMPQQHLAALGVL